MLKLKIDANKHSTFFHSSDRNDINDITAHNWINRMLYVLYTYKVSSILNLVHHQHWNIHPTVKFEFFIEFYCFLSGLNVSPHQFNCYCISMIKHNEEDKSKTGCHVYWLWIPNFEVIFCVVATTFTHLIFGIRHSPFDIECGFNVEHW